ncbi:hypothetical protein N9124_00390 [bacterium]|nr:hypothetical protein [Akkermansiaceae bacterium]MDB4296445.1 hypothetical protein [Akkermansiaceae bacterium]MDB4525467.1 hypothetical protein [Akkermansiaceae bacterium]MDB4546847.1 hypothetical protein [Akkermansiaceae bacterium]MDB4587925.1 hypothetical protein [bacterium]
MKLKTIAILATGAVFLTSCKETVEGVKADAEKAAEATKEAAGNAADSAKDAAAGAVEGAKDAAAGAADSAKDAADKIEAAKDAATGAAADALKKVAEPAAQAASRGSEAPMRGRGFLVWCFS